MSDRRSDRSDGSSGKLEGSSGSCRGGRPLPAGLLELARRLLDIVGEDRLAWLVGLPGSGKSTVLEACRSVDHRVRVVELAQELVSMGHPEGRPRPGGLQAVGDAASRVRERWSKEPLCTFVATTGVPAEAVPPVDGEVLLVLAVGEGRAMQQLGARPWRTARTAAPEEMTMHAENVRRLGLLPHAKHVEIPLMSELVGRAAPAL